jgi:hypothetical protein
MYVQPFSNRQQLKHCLATAMSSVADPMAEIARLRQELDKERQERNYFQLEKVRSIVRTMI